MSKLIASLLLLATIAQARPEWLYEPTDGLEGEYTEQRVKGFGYGTPSGAIYQGQDRKQAMRNVDVERVDIETGETNTVTEPQTVPVSEAYYAIGMSEPREATEAELAARAANDAAQAQASFAGDVQAFLSGNDGENQLNVIRFFTILKTMFPAITLPTTYDAALDEMNTAIEAANNAENIVLCNRLQNQSRIAQDIYNRVLVPNGWTGVRLAKLAAVLQ